MIKRQGGQSSRMRRSENLLLQACTMDHYQQQRNLVCLDYNCLKKMFMCNFCSHEQHQGHHLVPSEVFTQCLHSLKNKPRGKLKTKMEEQFQQREIEKKLNNQDQPIIKQIINFLASQRQQSQKKQRVKELQRLLEGWQSGQKMEDQGQNSGENHKQNVLQQNHNENIVRQDQNVNDEDSVVEIISKKDGSKKIEKIDKFEKSQAKASETIIEIEDSEIENNNNSSRRMLRSSMSRQKQKSLSLKEKKDYNEARKSAKKSQNIVKKRQETDQIEKPVVLESEYCEIDLDKQIEQGEGPTPQFKKEQNYPPVISKSPMHMKEPELIEWYRYHYPKTDAKRILSHRKDQETEFFYTNGEGSFEWVLQTDLQNKGEQEKECIQKYWKLFKRMRSAKKSTSNAKTYYKC